MWIMWICLVESCSSYYSDYSSKVQAVDRKCVTVPEKVTALPHQALDFWVVLPQPQQPPHQGLYLAAPLPYPSNLYAPGHVSSYTVKYCKHLLHLCHALLISHHHERYNQGVASIQVYWVCIPVDGRSCMHKLRGAAKSTQFPNTLVGH